MPHSRSRAKIRHIGVIERVVIERELLEPIQAGRKPGARSLGDATPETKIRAYVHLRGYTPFPGDRGLDQGIEVRHDPYWLRIGMIFLERVDGVQEILDIDETTDPYRAAPIDPDLDPEDNVGFIEPDDEFLARFGDLPTQAPDDVMTLAELLEERKA